MKGSNQALLVEHFGQIDAHEHRAGAKGHPRLIAPFPVGNKPASERDRLRVWLSRFNLGQELRVEHPAKTPTAYPAGTAFYTGLSSTYAVTETDGSQVGAQVMLTPLGARLLLGFPLSEVGDRLTDPIDLFGATARDTIEPCKRRPRRAASTPRRKRAGSPSNGSRSGAASRNWSWSRRRTRWWTCPVFWPAPTILITSPSGVTMRNLDGLGKHRAADDDA